MKPLLPNVAKETRSIIEHAITARDAGLSPDEIVARAAKAAGVFPSRVRHVLNRFEVLGDRP